MILCIRTDQPEVHVAVLDTDGAVVVERRWEAHRTLARDLLKVCDELMREAHSSLSSVSGIVVYRGPGSFTGLRIGCTIANTIAYSSPVPIIGADGEDWIAQGVSHLKREENDESVLPEYGANPRITKPRK